jgi:hypothetical protein
LEHHITADVDTLHHRVIDTVRLGAPFIADEDHLAAGIIELLEAWGSHLHMDEAPERPEMEDGRRAPCPELVEGLAPTLFDEDRLSRYTAVVIVSPQNMPGRPFAFRMLRAVPTTDWLRLSTMLFCCHKVSGSMGLRYGIAVRGTLLARDFYTSDRK